MSVYVKDTVFIACNCKMALLNYHFVEGQPMIFECIKCDSVWSNPKLDKLYMSDFEAEGFSFTLVPRAT